MEESIRNFPEVGTSTAATPAADHFIAQLLFVSTRAHRDIQNAVVFLSTRVKSPDEDN